MAKTLAQMVKATTPTDILLTGVLVGVAAAVTGAATWIDKTITGNTMGFKSTTPAKKTIARGALVGAVLSLPVAYISSTSNTGLGTAYNANVSNVFVDPGRFDNPAPAPKDYIYAASDTGQQYLIVDPKYGL